MKIKCINNNKCESFLETNKIYEAKESDIRENCYSVLVSDKKKRIKDGYFDFLKERFIGVDDNEAFIDYDY